MQTLLLWWFALTTATYVNAGTASHLLEQLLSQENVPLIMQKLNHTITGYNEVPKQLT
jgi:hypothetical protein